ncbi:MAG TPA: ATP-dependent zinc metalloprotease FtsH [Caulifigura sp.]|nr:ATP-dependent zinc metalloprotease FtsH [Caulifigura sp.]
MAPPEPTRNSDNSQKKRGKGEKGSSASFWTLIAAALLVTTLLAWIQKQSRGKEIALSDFKVGLENKDWNPSTVHEATFSPTELVFQDRPTKIDPEDQPAGVPTVPRPLGSAQRYRVPLVGVPPGTIEELMRSFDRKQIHYKGSAAETEWVQFLPLLMMAIAVIALIIFFRKLGGPGAAMSFGRSRGKLFADDDVKITFDDVAGINEAVEELREIVEFLKTPGKYQALGGRIPRGVLLVGPPGTGKTLLAKAVAGEAGVPFFSLSGSDFVEMFVGVGAARVRDMFAQAVQRSPSIIFIDELDALGKVRGSGMPGGHDEREQTLNALLVEMDGFSSDQSVIVMGATNRPETLDPALLRPGRFDRHVLVDRPDYKGREAVLRVHSAKIKLDEGVDLQRIAKLTPGMVGADLANLVNEAALLAARAGKSAVSSRELEEAIERVIAGLEKSSRIIHQDEKQRVAYHESGHALVACSLPHTDPVHKISIIPRGMGALGYMMQRPEDDRHLVTQTELQNRICTMFGGIAAEEVIYQEVSTGAQNDLERATDIARRMVMEFGMSPKMGRVNYRESKRSAFLAGASTGGADYAHSESTLREIDLEVKRIVDDCMETARDILKRRRAVLEQITKELIEVEVMDAEQLHRILDAHKTGPQIKPGTFVDRPAEDAPPMPAAVERRDAVEGA